MPTAFIAFFVLLALGYLARRSGRFSDSAVDTLNRFVIDVCLPALVLRLVPRLSLHADLLVLALAPWLAAALSFLFARLGKALFGWDLATSTAVFLCTAMGNTAFLGLPVISALLGENAVPMAVVYDQLGSFLVLSIVAPIAIARASSGSQPAVGMVARKVVTFPPFVALVVALIPFPHPVWLDDTLLTISNALVPTAIFAVGLRLRITPPAQKSALIVGLLLKLVVLPAIVFAAVRALHIAPDIAEVAVLQTAMPAMITAGAMAMMAGLAPELSAALVGWGIVLSLVTLKAWLYVMR